MATPRRPSLINRTMSTPPVTPISIPGKMEQSAGLTVPRTLLTPPTSPRHSRSSSNLSSSSFGQSSPLLLDTRLRSSSNEASANQYDAHEQGRKDSILQCPFDVEILKDQHQRDLVFGYGAWSTVFKGTTHNRWSPTTPGWATPPTSPIMSIPVLVAVKKPARQDARTILQNEARILTHLSRIDISEQYIVPFYGTFAQDGSIVMEAIPLSLDDHIRKCATNAKHTITTWNMTQPVVGSMETWLELAVDLISGLSWLHNDALVVHGDIKPGNILLVPALQSSAMSFPFRPLLIDFSSSQRLDTNERTPNTLSAVTREYTAPELLSAAVLRDPKSTATTASDVFSMAVTLLVAATGDTMVYPGSVFQRQAMATQGWQVLSLVRSSGSGSRIPRHGVVEKALEPAVRKIDSGRITSGKWLEAVHGITQSDLSKL